VFLKFFVFFLFSVGIVFKLSAKADVAADASSVSCAKVLVLTNVRRNNM
jgi:hypothetical protein